MQRARSLDLPRALWPRQPLAIRADAVEVRVYAVTYLPGVPPLAATAARMLHSFAIQQIEEPGRRTS